MPPQVTSNTYSWGRMVSIRQGSRFSVPLHPEHLDTITDLEDGDRKSLRTEDGSTWIVTLDGDRLRFRHTGQGYRLSVGRSEVL
jgi:hypothetical protein